MKRLLPVISMVALSSAAGFAQSAAPQSTAPATPAQTITMTMSSTVAQQYKMAKGWFIEMADKMPGDAYAFQPTPEMRSFAGGMGHLLMSNISQCGSLLGKKHALSGVDLSKTLTVKADVVKATAETFAFCDEYFLTLDDSTPLADTFVNMNGRRNGQPVTFKVSNGASVVHFLEHNNEMYGYLSVYMRLKGIVPPSSTPAPPAPGRGRGAGGR